VSQEALEGKGAEEREQSKWMAWWRNLIAPPGRAGRAELRRCGSVAEAAFCVQFHKLRWSAPVTASNEVELKKLALIAVVLSHVESNAEERGRGGVARAMAAASGDRPVVSEARFRQILRTEEEAFDERLADLVRIIRQLKRSAPVDRLAQDLWFWNERTRRRWALEYFDGMQSNAGESSASISEAEEE